MPFVLSSKTSLKRPRVASSTSSSRRPSSHHHRHTVVASSGSGALLLPVMALLMMAAVRYLTSSMEEWNNYRNYQDFFHVVQQHENEDGTATTQPASSSSSALFQLATEQSYGFFHPNVISNTAWQRLQQRALTAPQFKFPEFPERAFGVPVRWLIKNLQPVLTCPLAERIGGAVDVGAFWTCDPYQLLERGTHNNNNNTANTTLAIVDVRDDGDNENNTPTTTTTATTVTSSSSSSTLPCLVYCLGYSGAWEQEFVQRYGDVCEVHIMDSSLVQPAEEGSLHHSRGDVHWHAWGLDDVLTGQHQEDSLDDMEDTDDVDVEAMDGSATAFAKLSAPPTSLQEMRELLGHADRQIDIVKVDFGVQTWTTYEQWIALNATQILWQLKGLPNPKQAHPTYNPDGPFRFSAVFRTLQDYGYIMFAKDHRLLGPRVALGYLRLHPDFWREAEQYAAASKAVQTTTTKDP